MPLTEEQKKQARESVADLLAKMAEEIRSEKLEVTHLVQKWPITRYWANGEWKYFRLDDLQFSITYFNKEQRQAEVESLKKYLEENSTAELGILKPE